MPLISNLACECQRVLSTSSHSAFVSPCYRISSQRALAYQGFLSCLQLSKLPAQSQSNFQRILGLGEQRKVQGERQAGLLTDFRQPWWPSLCFFQLSCGIASPIIMPFSLLPWLWMESNTESVGLVARGPSSPPGSTSCEILGKLLEFSASPFPQCEKQGQTLWLYQDAMKIEPRHVSTPAQCPGRECHGPRQPALNHCLLPFALSKFDPGW